MTTVPIEIAPETFASLQLGAWNGLDDTARAALGAQLAERLAAHGWGVDEPLALRRFGPAGEEQAVLQWREPGTGMTFSLVPGGTFRPGFDPTLMGRYEALRAQLGPEPDEEVDEPPGHALPHGSARACDLRQRNAVTTDPFLMATEVVPASLPRIQDLLNLPWIKHIHEFHPFKGYNASVIWDKVDGVLGRLGWELPTSAEFEWALRGGRDSLFYWGDEPAEFMVSLGAQSPPDSWYTSFDQVMSSRFGPDRPQSWPWCNRFGLAAMLAEGNWCVSQAEADDDAPLIVRGGASSSWGWQGCGEWMVLLTAVECYQSRYGFDNCLRPILRLKARAT